MYDKLDATFRLLRKMVKKASSKDIMGSKGNGALNYS